MAVNFTCSFTALCCLALWSFTGTSGAWDGASTGLLSHTAGTRSPKQSSRRKAQERASIQYPVHICSNSPCLLIKNVPPPHSTIRPGSPVPVNTNNPRVRKAARFGVYRYNNSSNDLFLFKESLIKKAMVQIVRGLKYMLHVEIKRTVCEKRDHSSLDSCHFQREKNLQQVYKPLLCRASWVEARLAPFMHAGPPPVCKELNQTHPPGSYSWVTEESVHKWNAKMLF